MSLRGEFITYNGVTVFVHGDEYCWVVSSIPIDDEEGSTAALEIAFDDMRKGDAVAAFVQDYLRLFSFEGEPERHYDYVDEDPQDRAFMNEVMTRMYR